MVINKEISKILKAHNIDISQGILCLMAIYFKLEPDRTIPEEVIKSINTTKIVDKVYTSTGHTIEWAIPLFEGEEVVWNWVKDGYNKMWNKFPARKDGNSDVTNRMKEWFKTYPQYRKEDVQKATLAYFKTVREEQYCKRSALFIFDGKGASRVSLLLSWCEKAVTASSINNMRGTITE